MTEIELKRKELDRLIIEKDFQLSDEAVISAALKYENEYLKSAKA